MLSDIHSFRVLDLRTNIKSGEYPISLLDNLQQFITSNRLQVTLILSDDTDVFRKDTFYRNIEKFEKYSGGGLNQNELIIRKPQREDSIDCCLQEPDMLGADVDFNPCGNDCSTSSSSSGDEEQDELRGKKFSSSAMSVKAFANRHDAPRSKKKSSHSREEQNIVALYDELFT